MSDEKHLEPLRPNDAVTIVFADHLVLVKVSMSTRDRFYIVIIERTMEYLLVDEGKTWLRGYHAPDDEVVKAAQAAQTLDTSSQDVLPAGLPAPIVPLPLITPPQPLPPPPGAIVGGGVFPGHNIPTNPAPLVPPWPGVLTGQQSGQVKK